MEMSRLIFLIQFFSQIYAQEQSDNFAEILQPQAILCKYLKEKCTPDHSQQLFFKYFVKSSSILKLSSKVS